MIDSTSSSEFNELLKVSNVHTVFALHLVEETFQLRVLIRADDENFFETRDLTASEDVMFNYW